ncbi:cytochrome c maturation protein CcmE [Oceanospirillum linum]|uniref:Cytochrome c-type biogenesis protein CcmE n=1 Tax=Oceanospirillum linum TaxID=966 RepID=A0A1T1HFB7_OCELI|nr:cytochrome c maturation protein CcmE [Oceanospirillum linum]OOV88549.1 cytochrome c biogenesis protein CcmE [Oceanospirillum linum]SEF60419.1 cytochrome c-type biogenesis protein CcmE [Oleiphilus messinensis]SMP06933.1 cytochrome c-type biogenesis protein CcmE [Oceanospirillum linum]
MNPKRKKKLVLLSSMVAAVAVAVGLVLFALSENINLFYTPTQIAEGEAPVGQRIRAGGMVVEGSIKRAPDSLDVEFMVTDFEHEVVVKYSGILPDLFREGQGIVTMGAMNADGQFEASEVLAKHDENYMPPEVEAALKASGKTVSGESAVSAQ